MGIDSSASVTLVARFADNTASQLTTGLSAAIRQATQGADDQIQKFGRYICTSIEKSVGSVQLDKAFSSILKDMGRGNFADAHLDSLSRIKDGYLELGQVQKHFLTQQAEMVQQMARMPLIPQLASTGAFGGSYRQGYNLTGMPEVGPGRGNATSMTDMQMAMRKLAEVRENEDAQTRFQESVRAKAAASSYSSSSNFSGYVNNLRLDNEANQRSLAQKYNASPYGPEDNGLSSREATLRANREVEEHQNRQRLATLYNANPYGSADNGVLTARNNMLQDREETARREERSQVNQRLAAAYNANPYDTPDNGTLAARNNLRFDDEANQRRLSQKYNANPYGPSDNGLGAAETNREISRREAMLVGDLPIRSRIIPDKHLQAEVALARIIQTQDADATYNITPRTSEEWERYNSMPGHIQSRMDFQRDKRNIPRNFMAGHNFRFVSQQAGFGIDDAIQSYHYGGVGASIRAASNNLTAMAGMGIANPAIAATSVVALSVMTAALPMILRSFGIDEKVTKAREAIADIPYKRDGSSGGAARRGTLTTSIFESKIDAVYKLSDQLNSDATTRKEAHSYLDTFGFGHELRDTKGENTLVEGNISGVIQSLRDPAATEKFNSTIKWLREDFLKNPTQISQYYEANEHVDFIEKKLPEMFSRQEQRTVRQRQHQVALYQATDLNKYNQEIERNRDIELNIIDKDGNRSSNEKKLDKAKIRAHASEQLSQQFENVQTIIDNTENRLRNNQSFEHSSYGVRYGDHLRHLTEEAAHRNADTWNSEAGKKLTPEEVANRIRQNKEGFDIQAARINRDETRHYEDQLRSNLWFTGEIGSLTVAHRRKLEDYADPNNVQFSAEHRKELTLAENKGFAQQRAETMTGMMNQFKVTNPLGQIQDAYSVEAKKLQKQIDEGAITPAEGEKLTKNLKNSYAVSMIEANKPHGTERFTSDAMTVGSAADRELQARMLGNFAKPEIQTEEFQNAILKKFDALIEALGITNEKLEVARLGLN